MTNVFSTISSYFWDYATPVAKVAKAKVEAKAQQKVEEKIKQTSDKIGNAAKNFFSDLIYKDPSIIGKDINGNTVNIYKTQPNLIQNLVKNATGFDVKGNIPILPGFISNEILKKLDSMLVDKVGSLISFLTSAGLEMATIIAVAKATGASQQFIDEQINKIEKAEKVELLEADVKAILIAENKEVSDKEISDLTKMFNHYIALTKIYLNDFIEEAVASTASHYAGEIIEYANEAGEKYIKAGITAGAFAGAACAAILNPAVGIMAAGVVAADKELDMPNDPSYVTQLSKDILSYFWDKEAAKELAQDMVQLNAKIAVQKNMPTSFALNEELMKEAYGTYKPYQIDVNPSEVDPLDKKPDISLDMSFISIVRDEQPMSLTKLVSNFIPSVVKETTSDVVIAVKETVKDMQEETARSEEKEWEQIEFQKGEESFELLGQESTQAESSGGWFSSWF